MEVLHKAMVTMLGSSQLRDVLLYTALLVIFAIAWVFVRWPDLTFPAVLIASVLLIGGALLLYAAKRRASSPPDA